MMAQCARCGSSVTADDCETCGGEGLDGHDCGEDSCCCIDDGPNLDCSVCEGVGVFQVCLSSPEWCEAHPMEGREATPRGEIEWFPEEQP